MSTQIKIQPSSYLSCSKEIILNNFKILLSHRNTSICPIVKAGGYGVGCLELAQNYESLNVPLMGVACYKEAVFLRANGIKTPLFVIHLAKEEVLGAVELDLEPAVCTHTVLQALEESAKALGKSVKVHLHLNTGMTRLGASDREILELADVIKKSPHLELSGFFSHLSSSEKPEEDDFTLEQYHRFKETLKKLPEEPKWKHLANSSAHLRFDFSECNLSRIGLALLGIFLTPACRLLPLQSALELKTKVIHLQECLPFESVSYGRSFINGNTPKLIATLPIGYHDVPLLKKTSSVSILGKKAKVTGDVCMDFTMVDVTEIPQIKVGDEVEIFGGSQSPEELALSSLTHPHALISTLGPRIERRFI